MASYFGTPTSEYYVDSEGGSDANDGLSVGTAWETIAYACLNVTRTTLTRINVRARTTPYIVSSVSVTNNTGVPTLIQGFTTVAGDGGRPYIQGDDASSLFISGHNISGNYFQDLHFRNVPAAHYALYVNGYGYMKCFSCDFENAKVYMSSVRLHTHSVLGCRFFGDGAFQRVWCGGLLSHCLFDARAIVGPVQALVSTLTAGSSITGCVFLVKSGIGAITNSHGKRCYMNNNLFIGTDGGGTGIEGNLHQTSYDTVMQNVFVGLDAAIEPMGLPGYRAGMNAIYDCVAGDSSASLVKFPDFNLTDHPCPNWATGDYEIRVSGGSFGSGGVPVSLGPAGYIRASQTFHPLGGLQ